MEQCIFCSIISHDIPSTIRWENEEWIAFDDIHPKAQTHVLLVSKKHISSLSDASEEDHKLLEGALWRVRELAEHLGIVSHGYRVMINCGRGAGQLVDHLHIHLMSGGEGGDLHGRSET